MHSILSNTKYFCCETSIESEFELENLVFLSKNVLSFDDASSSFLDLSKVTCGKLASASMPHYKPQGKMLYFEKAGIRKRGCVKTGEDAGADKTGAEIYRHRPLKK